MSFFNKKEEVLHIKPTQYGKYLISQGKFKPTYYAFFDDDVVYDSKYMGPAHEEQQNNAEPRIQEDTPTMKVQHVFTGIETNIKKLNREIRSGKVALGSEQTLPVAEQHFGLSSPIGNSSVGEQNAPAFEVQFWNGTITGSVSHLTGSHATMKIPQLDTEVMFETSIGSTAEDSSAAPGLPGTIYEDETFIKIEDDYLIIEFLEHNTEFQMANFDIEVFLVEEEDVSGSIKTPGLPELSQRKRTHLLPLSFVKSPEQVVNGILVDQRPASEYRLPDPGPAYINYFLDLHVDHEIDPVTLCDSVPESRTKDPLFDSPTICAERKASVATDSEIRETTGEGDMYSSEVSTEDFEECD
jgi:uncharacterized protein YozE (UPF0346 family)